jgi:hypothetical protein
LPQAQDPDASPCAANPATGAGSLTQLPLQEKRIEFHLAGSFGASPAMVACSALFVFFIRVPER